MYVSASPYRRQIATFFYPSRSPRGGKTACIFNQQPPPLARFTMQHRSCERQYIPESIDKTVQYSRFESVLSSLSPLFRRVVARYALKCLHTIPLPAYRFCFNVNELPRLVHKFVITGITTLAWKGLLRTPLRNAIVLATFTAKRSAR